MKADMLLELCRLASGEETLVVECEGYELDVFGIEYDEYEGVVRLKATPYEEDGGPPWLDNDDEEEEGPPGSIHDKEEFETEVPMGTFCPAEPPQSHSVNIDGPELKEG